MFEATITECIDDVLATPALQRETGLLCRAARSLADVQQHVVQLLAERGMTAGIEAAELGRLVRERIVSWCDSGWPRAVELANSEVA